MGAVREAERRRRRAHGNDALAGPPPPFPGSVVPCSGQMPLVFQRETVCISSFPIRHAQSGIGSKTQKQSRTGDRPKGPMAVAASFPEPSRSYCPFEPRRALLSPDPKESKAVLTLPVPALRTNFSMHLSR